MQFETPFGPAWAAIDATGAVTAFSFSAGKGHGGDNPEVARQIEEFFAGKRQRLRFSPRAQGQRLSETSMGRAGQNPFRRDHQLRRARPADRKPVGIPRRRSRQRHESNSAHRSLSSRNRVERQTDWLRGRYRFERKATNLGTQSNSRSQFSWLSVFRNLRTTMHGVPKRVLHSNREPDRTHDVSGH